MKNWVADFETVVDPNETRVWAWGIADISPNPEPSFKYGATIDEFFEWCRPKNKQTNKKVYFHNLKFDGEFLIYHLLVNMGFRYSDEKLDKTFNCIISNMGQFYQIEVIWEKKNKKYKKVTFYDSHKKLPFPVDKIGKDFKLPYKKVKVDEEFYKRERPIGHELTLEEIHYLKHDLLVMSSALHIQFEQGMDKMTIGSDAMKVFKSFIDKQVYEYNFPILPLPIDDDIREAYRGGCTYLHSVGEREVKAGIVIDRNSMYPAVMYYRPLPYGYPLQFEGEYKSDEMYPLYIQALECAFELKPNKLPTLQVKNLHFAQNEYLKNSGYDKNGKLVPIPLVLTSVDLELFFEHYKVKVWEWRGGYKFRATTGIFRPYIDKFMAQKEAHSKDKDALYQLAKLLLNNLYGKFASRTDVTGKYPIIEDDHVRYKKKEVAETRDPVYTPIGVFITSWARYEIITSAQKVYPRFIYMDTDSLHLEGTEIPEELDIHESRLGAWAVEGYFTRARFVRQKTYIEEIDGYLHVTCAGMPDNVKKLVTWENFREGQVWWGKKRPKHIKGGIVLEDSYFTIKNNVV